MAPLGKQADCWGMRPRLVCWKVAGIAVCEHLKANLL